MTDLRQIAPLPVALRSIIRSTTIVTSLPQIVSELVQNSLDASASNVDVGVDVEQWQCWVRDDGHGMDRAGMKLLAKGSDEGRYGTSKAYTPSSLESVSTFGFRGEALVSAADVSCLEISSRTSTSRETWSVILKGGKKLYFGPAVRWRREKPGTSVIIRDAFYNLPIRRLSHSSPSRTLELIRKDLETAALVFPGVAFSLENSTKEKEEGNGRGRLLTIPKTSSSLTAFKHLFGRALCEHVDEIDVRSGEMRIQGFFSLQGAHSKAYQYLYVNRHPLSPCDLHRTIDAQYTASSFGKHALDEAGKTRSLAPGLRRSPRKNERRPVYVLNVTIPPRLIDNFLEPAKAAVHFENPEAVSNFVSSVVQSFLVRHDFHLGKAQPKKRTTCGSSSPHKRRKISIDHDGDPNPTNKATLVGGTTSMTPRPLRPRRSATYTPLIVDPTMDDSQEVHWADPATGQLITVDARTGNSYLLEAGRDGLDNPDDMHRNDGKRRKLVDTRRLCRKLDPTARKGEAVPDWIEQALDGWKNPTFGLQEPEVPRLTSISSFSRQFQSGFDSVLQPNKPSLFFDPILAAGRANNATDVSASFDKAQLKCAEVLGQVDQKFIAIVIKDTAANTKTLVLVDQHAADERIRVEELLSKLCQGFLKHDTRGGVEMRTIQPPLPVLLTRHEAMTLSSSEVYREAFEKWGFRFAQILLPSATDQQGAGDEYVQVLVEALPELLSEKLLLGDELRELIKGILAKLGTESDIHTAAPRSSDTHWTTALRWCPSELLGLVNSKACRGAIMFNDPLDIEQCRRLILQLSETVWPFMCAHGRPSLVPLTNVDRERGSTRSIDWSRIEQLAVG